MSEGCPEGVWRLSGQCMEAVWKVSRRCLQGIKMICCREQDYLKEKYHSTGTSYHGSLGLIFMFLEAVEHVELENTQS